MWFRVLGPVEIHGPDQVVSAGTAKEAAVLAALLLDAGRMVSVESLAERVWDEAIPPSARSTLQAYVCRIRAKLRAAGDQTELIGRSGVRGYRLDVEPEQVDALRFQGLVARAQAEVAGRRPRVAVALLREAESLWVGQALEGVAGQWAQSVRAGLAERLRAVRLARIELELRLGVDAQVLSGELVELVGADRSDQRAAELLMQAFDASGRPARALALYREITARLRDELAIEPRGELTRLHTRILRGEQQVWAETAGAIGPIHTLEPAPAYWCGREDLVERLAGEIGRDLHAGTGVGIYALDGMVGVGKTALALRVAHLMAGRFPDGVLQVNLRAHDPRHPAVDLPAALALLLDAIGADAKQINDAGSLDALSMLWRRYSTDRRILVLIDDAAGIEDVSALLPAGPGGAVLLTSRRRLLDVPGARQYTLAPLSAAEALGVVERISGRRMDEKSPAASRVAGGCGGLPLALTLAAAFLRAHPTWSIEDLADRMESVSRPDPGDALIGPLDVAISLSYRDLSGAHRTLLRCVAALPGASFSLDAAAAALDTERGVLDRQLEVLVDHHLIDELERHRYRLHDAIRAYALGIVPGDRRAAAATQRAAAYYIATAARAERLLRPYRRAAQRVAQQQHSLLPHFSNRSAAQDWLTAEYTALRELAENRTTPLPPVAQVCLAGILAKHLDLRGMWNQARDLLERAGQAAREHPDPLPALVEAELATDTAAAHIRTGHFVAALALAEHAFALFTAQDDARGQADALMEIGRVHRHGAEHRKALTALRASAAAFARAQDTHGRIHADLQRAVVLHQSGRHAQALRLAERGRAEAAAFGDEALLVDALTDLGEIHRLAGHLPAALAHFTDARTLAQQLGDQLNLATLALNLGYIYRDTGLWDEALDELTTSRGIFARMRDDYHEAEALIALTELHRRRGHLGPAGACLDAGESIAERSGRRPMILQAAAARARLSIDQGRPADAAHIARALLAQCEATDAAAIGEAQQILAHALAAIGTDHDDPSDRANAA